MKFRVAPSAPWAIPFQFVGVLCVCVCFPGFFQVNLPGLSQLFGDFWVEHSIFSLVNVVCSRDGVTKKAIPRGSFKLGLG